MAPYSEIVSRLKPRILVLDRFYFPDEQATSILLTELTEGLRDRFEFEILCGPPLTLPSPPERERIKGEGIRIYNVSCPRLPKQILFARFLNDLSFLFMAFFRGLFLSRPDLILSQTSPPGIWWIAFLLSRWHRTPWIHVSQDIFPDNLKALGALPNGRIFSWFDPFSSFPLRKADRIVGVGQDIHERMVQKGFSESLILQIPNWADLEFIRPLTKSNSFSKQYGLVDKFVVLYAGNFGRVHNFEDLLDAAEQLSVHPKIQFLLVGEGAFKKWLMREVQSRKLSNVRILPFEPRSRLPEVLASADVSVILLRKGMAGLSVPSKIYSILASGRPAIACVEDESDIARLVRESNAGFVVPPGDSEAFAKAVTELFGNQTKKHQMGVKARQFAEQMDFKTHALHDYEQIFREILERDEARV